MTDFFKCGIAALAMGAGALLGQPAYAATVYESATLGSDDTGEYIVQDGRSIGAAFSIGETTHITVIGGQFGGYPSGTIFGAIVPLASLDAYPAGAVDDLASIALADIVFSVTLPPLEAGHYVQFGDVLAPLSVTLAAGDYAVIFGSGQFGANGWAGLGYLNDTVGSPRLIQTLFGDEWMEEYDHGIRIFVEGDAVSGAVPEPASWALMILGFGALGTVMRRRARTVAFA